MRPQEVELEGRAGKTAVQSGAPQLSTGSPKRPRWGGTTPPHHHHRGELAPCQAIEAMPVNPAWWSPLSSSLRLQEGTNLLRGSAFQL